MEKQVLEKIRDGLIVSCQALINEPLHGSDVMAKMAFAAKWGGAHGIRANSPKDIQAIRSIVDLPIIGIYKYTYPSFKPFITPTFTEAKLIADAGADVIAIDATLDAHPVETVAELIERIHLELKLPVLADISTVEEAIQADGFGADLVATTLRGYTAQTAHAVVPDTDFLRDVTRAVNCPVIAEGNVRTPSQAKQMMDAGAFAVVVGSAITRPQDITRWFVDAISQ